MSISSARSVRPNLSILWSNWSTFWPNDRHFGLIYRDCGLTDRDFGPSRSRSLSWNLDEFDQKYKYKNIYKLFEHCTIWDRGDVWFEMLCFDVKLLKSSACSWTETRNRPSIPYPNILDRSFIYYIYRIWAENLEGLLYTLCQVVRNVPTSKWQCIWCGKW